MTDATWETQKTTLIESFLFLIPDFVTLDAKKELDATLDRNRYWLGQLGERETIQAGELMAVGYGLRRYVPDALSDVPPNPRTDPVLARALFDACGALTAGGPADGPLPPNWAMVTRRGDEVYVPVGLGPRFTNQSALELAVWLIAIADPTLSTAVPMLLRVATR